MKTKPLALFGVFATALILPFVSLSTPAHACSCIQTTTDENFANAEYVFLGTVDELTIDDSQEGLIGAGSNTATFTIKENYKGDLDEYVEITTASNSAACGVNFEAGNDYVVYASKDDTGYYTTNLCSGTQMVAVDDEILSDLVDLEKDGPVRTIDSHNDLPPAPPSEVDDRVISTPPSDNSETLDMIMLQNWVLIGLLGTNILVTGGFGVVSILRKK